MTFKNLLIRILFSIAAILAIFSGFHSYEKHHCFSCEGETFVMITVGVICAIVALFYAGVVDIFSRENRDEKLG